MRERDPERIGINTSRDFAFGDGISHTEFQLAHEALGESYAGRLVSGGEALRWLAGAAQRGRNYCLPAAGGNRSPNYRARLSTAVIHPSVSTTDDVVWWMRETMAEAGLSAWFQPTIDIQAPGQTYQDTENPRSTIMPGDLLHCDMGFHYLGLATDQQQHAYVLRAGESDAPAGLRAALADGNRLQGYTPGRDAGRSQRERGIAGSVGAARIKKASARRFIRIRLAYMATRPDRWWACGIDRMACRASAIIRFMTIRCIP